MQIRALWQLILFKLELSPVKLRTGVNKWWHWPVLLLQVVEDPLQLSLLLRFHGDEDLGWAAGLAERRALVQRLAVVLDQHVLVIAANAHTKHTQPVMGRHTHIHMIAETPVRAHTHTDTQEENEEKENQQVDETAVVTQDCTTEKECITQQGQREGQSCRLHNTFVLNSIWNTGFRSNSIGHTLPTQSDLTCGLWCLGGF